MISINKPKQVYDVILCSHFQNEEDLNIYQNHPEHVKVRDFIVKVVENRIVADYEV